ncbi:MAG: hypothetical protein J5627_02900 [Bacilli bacterium]|nr:hypothetical protein [Bacilli bacterium]
MSKEKKPLNMKKGGLIWSIWNFIEAALLLTMGILVIANCTNSDIQANVFIVISIFLMVGGLLKIVANFLPVIGATPLEVMAKQAIRAQLSYDLVIGGTIELAFGVALCVSMTTGDPAAIIGIIMNFIVWLVSGLLIVSGVSLVAFAIGFIVSKLYKLYMPILEIILGVLLIGAGVAIIILFTNNSEIVMSIMLVIVGAALAVGAVFKVIGVVKAILKNKEEKEPDENVIDAPETFEVKEEEPKEETVQETESTEVAVIEETNE